MGKQGHLQNQQGLLIRIIIHSLIMIPDAKDIITLCSLDLGPGVIGCSILILHSFCDELCFFHTPAFLFRPLFNHHTMCPLP